MATQVTITTKNIEQNPAIKIVYLSGEIDESNLKDLQDNIAGFVSDPGTSTVILNLKDLHYINSKVIGYLAGYYTEMSQANKKIIFVEANAEIMDILALVGLTNIIEHYENESQAIQSVSS